MRLLPIVRPAAASCGCRLSNSIEIARSSSRRAPPLQQQQPHPIVPSSGTKRGLATRQPEPEQEEGDDRAVGEMLKRVMASRHSAKAFDTGRCEVPEPVLAEVLAMTLVRVSVYEWMP